MPRPFLVASAGGHLDELMILADQMRVATDDAVWVSSPTTQTRSVLAGKEVVWLPRIGSGERDKALRALPSALRLHHHLRPELVISTGALFAVPHLLAAAAHGCETWFVDSATRLDGPSQTGRLAQALPRLRLMAQGEGWGDRRWDTVPCVLDAFEAHRRPTPGGAEEDRPPRVVLSLGSELWPFPRAVESLLRAVPGAEMTWQTGSTEVVHEGRPLQQWLPAEELCAAFAAADTVVTHAGVGSVLACLREGKVPVVLPRTARHGEHIDDHQWQFARLLSERGLAVCVDPDGLTTAHLDEAAGLLARQRQPRPSSDPLAHPLDGPDDPGR